MKPLYSAAAACPGVWHSTRRHPAACASANSAARASSGSGKTGREAVSSGGTTVDVRILSHDSPHNLRKPVRLFKALFDLRHMINGSCTDFREHTAYTQVGAHKIALIQVKLLTLYKATDNDIDKIGSNGHHDELSDSNPSCQPSGKGAQFALFLLLTQLVGLYSFYSTSISVKVSMISPTSMSPKLTSEIPHSRPVATSLASSL